MRWALELGYRHIDTAQAYGNERSVGKALRDSGVRARGRLHHHEVLSGQDDPEAEAQRSLERLGVEYVDLYIIHWPQGGPTWAWDGMQRAQAAGYARSIGVSNFSASELDELLAISDVDPVVNQVQFSPFEFRRGAVGGGRGALDRARGLQPARHRPPPRRPARRARSPSALGRTPAQVLIRWALERNLIVLPKSTHRERIEANAQVFDFALSEEDVAALDALDHTGGTAAARESIWW